MKSSCASSRHTPLRRAIRARSETVRTQSPATTRTAQREPLFSARGDRASVDAVASSVAAVPAAVDIDRHSTRGSRPAGRALATRGAAPARSPRRLYLRCDGRRDELTEQASGGGPPSAGALVDDAAHLADRAFDRPRVADVDGHAHPDRRLDQTRELGAGGVRGVATR